MYLRFFVLLHADNTMLFSESPDDLHHQFVCFFFLQKMWHLKVNSQIALFNKGRCHVDFSFKYDVDIKLENADNFEYLGLHFC